MKKVSDVGANPNTIINPEYRMIFRFMVWFPMIYTALFLLLGLFGLDKWILQLFDIRSFWLYDWVPLADSYRSYLWDTPYRENLPVIMHITAVQQLGTLIVFLCLLVMRIRRGSNFLTRPPDRDRELNWRFDLLGFFVLGILLLMLTRGVPESVDSTRVMNSFHPERGGVNLLLQSLLHAAFFAFLISWLELRLLRKNFSKEETTA